MDPEPQDPSPAGPLLGLVPGGPTDQLAYVVETMRAMSSQTDPQQMVAEYGGRVRRLLDIDCSVSLSRRDVARPQVVVTRTSLSRPDHNPWAERGSLPVLGGGLLSDLIWGDVPVIINDLAVDASDPAAAYLGGMRSLVAIPLYDQGRSLNMVVLARRMPGGFDARHLPEHVWMSNLFGRAAHMLVLSQELRRAYDAIDRELATVAEIQHSLLPATLPAIPTLDLAAHYQTSRHAGGDYYDFFPLADGRWGILLADVSGHGTPAAVIMAVTHSIAHALPGPADPPGRLLAFVNGALAARYTAGTGTFVTAFYGVYDPAQRSLVYASAGHPPPLLRRAATGDTELLDTARGLPLGIEPDERFPTATARLGPGDALLIYTDGFSEARSPGSAFFNTDGLAAALSAAPDGTAADLLGAVLHAVDAFTAGGAPTDDRTLLAVRIC